LLGRIFLSSFPFRHPYTLPISPRSSIYVDPLRTHSPKNKHILLSPPSHHKRFLRLAKPRKLRPSLPLSRLRTNVPSLFLSSCLPSSSTPFSSPSLTSPSGGVPQRGPIGESWTPQPQPIIPLPCPSPSRSTSSVGGDGRPSFSTDRASPQQRQLVVERETSFFCSRLPLAGQGADPLSLDAVSLLSYSRLDLPYPSFIKPGGNLSISLASSRRRSGPSCFAGLDGENDLEPIFPSDSSLERREASFGEGEDGSCSGSGKSRRSSLVWLGCA
jgi:hypothetical protein